MPAADPKDTDLQGFTTRRLARRHALGRDIALLTRDFMRQFLLCTKEELVERRWLEPSRKLAVRLGLESFEKEPGPFPVHRMLAALEADFEGHVPLYEFAYHVVYCGETLDRNTQKKVLKAEYWLQEEFHKDLMMVPIQQELIGKKNTSILGLALFVSRNALKTYCLICACAWVLTRHRVIFDDFCTTRILHDSQKMAQLRGEEVKAVFQHNAAFRLLYPEVALPPDKKWQAEDSWNLKDRKVQGGTSIDPQVACRGMKTVKQGAHPDYDFIDDVENERHMRSVASREESEAFFKGISYSAQLGSVRRVLAGTLYSRHGTHAMIMDASNTTDEFGQEQVRSWDKVLLPAILDEGLPTERPLYPKRLSLEVLEALRQQEITKYGTDAFYQMQMMLRFRSITEQIFRAKFRRVDLIRPTSELEREIVRALRSAIVCVAGDYAHKDPESAGRGDFTAIVVIALIFLAGRAAPFRVLLDAVYANNLDPIAAGNETLRLAKMYGADYIFPEEPGQKTNGPVISNLAAERGLPYYQAFKRPGSGATDGNIVSIVPRSNAANDYMGLGAAFSTWKWAMFRAFIADYNSGSWIFAKNVEALEGLVEEMDDFPGGRVDFINALSLLYDERIQHYLPRPRALPSKQETRARNYVLVPQIPNTGLVEKVRM